MDKVDYLLRTKTIDKLAHGGSRDIKAQLDSIGVNPNMSVEGDVVLIVDDVTRSESPSGNQLLIDSRKASAVKDTAALIDFVGQPDYAQMSLFG